MEINMLIILGGLPGVGKTTIAKSLAKHLQAVYLRIDSIEEALKNSLNNNIKKLNGPEGYMTAYAVAKDNLLNGLTVVADSVNPIELSRSQWRETAVQVNRPYIEIEIICSDKEFHQQRVESRKVDIPGQILPTWQDVLNRDYEEWTSKKVTIDTAVESIACCVDKIIYQLKLAT